MEKLKLRISKEYSLIDAKKAHEDLEARKLTGPSYINSIMENKIISPCISICRTDPVTGIVMVALEQMKKKKMER